MCPQIEGPNLPYRRGAETALCNTAKSGGRGPVGVILDRDGRSRKPVYVRSASNSDRKVKDLAPVVVCQEPTWSVFDRQGRITTRKHKGAGITRSKKRAGFGRLLCKLNQAVLDG
jgi:hypothetical protein